MPPDGEDWRPDYAPPPGGGYSSGSIPSPHRRIPDLFNDTFNLVGRRWRDLVIIAIVLAAVTVLSLVPFTLGGNILSSELVDTDEFEALTVDSTEADDISDESDDAFGDWVDSIDSDRLGSGVALIFLGLLASLLAWAPTVAFALVALDDVEGRPTVVSRALLTGLVRVPKLLLLAIIYVVALAAAVFVLAIALVVGYGIHLALGVILTIAFAAAFLGLLLLLVPLVQLHFTIAFVEPGFPSRGRWWTLMRRALPGTWGRSALVLVMSTGVLWVLGLSMFTLPYAYGSFIVNVLFSPIVGALTTIAYVLMYADLTGRGRPSLPE